MAHISKRYKALTGKVDRAKLYPVQEALKIIKENATAKFNESIDFQSIWHRCQEVGSGRARVDRAAAGHRKVVRVAVFAQGDKAQQAKDAGADIVGLDDLANEIKAARWISMS